MTDSVNQVGFALDRLARWWNHQGAQIPVESDELCIFVRDKPVTAFSHDAPAA